VDVEAGGRTRFEVDDVGGSTTARRCSDELEVLDRGWSRLVDVVRRRGGRRGRGRGSSSDVEDVERVD
jgi:hypothetical protein